MKETSTPLIEDGDGGHGVDPDVGSLLVESRQLRKKGNAGKGGSRFPVSAATLFLSFYFLGELFLDLAQKSIQ